MRIIIQCLIAASLAATTEAVSQTPFDRSIYLPGDTLLGAGIELHVINAGNGDLIVSDFQQFDNGPGQAPQHGFVHRIGLDGALQWRTRIAAPLSAVLRLGRAHELADGSIAQAGPSFYNDGLYLRFAADGSALSARGYENGTTMTEVYAVQPLSDSTILMVGATSGPDRAPLLIWADYDGHVDSAKAITIPGSRGMFTRILPCGTGGYLVTGPGNGTAVPDTIFFNALIARLDEHGEVLWAERFEELEQAGIWGMAGAHELPDGTIRFFARSRPAGTAADKVWMIALAADGSLLWKRKLRFPSFGSGLNVVASVSASDSTFLLVGGYVPIGHVAVVVHEDGTVLSGGGSAVGAVYPTYDAAIAADGQLVTVALTLAPGGLTEGLLPRIIKDEVVPTMCSPYTFSAAYDSLDFDFTAEWSSALVTLTESDVADQLEISTELPQVLENCLPTAIPQDEKVAVLRAMPNPGRDRVLIAAPGITQVRVHDALGNELPVRVTLRANGAELDIERFEPGPYIVRALWAAGWSSVLLIRE